MSLLDNGDYYRLSNPDKDGFAIWELVAKDKKEAVVSVVYEEVIANPGNKTVCLKGLEKDRYYKEKYSKRCYLGEQLMAGGILLERPKQEYDSVMYHFVMQEK